MDIARSLETPIEADLARKMVFLAGPRQVGKTSLARRLLARAGGGRYLNWDRREDRKAIRAAQWPPGEGLVVLDEIHKWSAWKRWIKGEFDVHRDRLRFLVTGSARMDVYRRGGDSLQGRYHQHRLHPLSVAEIAGGGGAPALPRPGAELPVPGAGDRDLLDGLLERSGFPEPFLAGSGAEPRRWRAERLDRFFREDVRDLEHVRDMSSMEILADLLPERVGAPLSINPLAEDLEVSHRAVTRWMEIFERLFLVFRLRPFEIKRVRSLRRMPKAYLWDWSSNLLPGARFENLVASHLLKFCHGLADREGFDAELWYLRDRMGRETDFLVTVDRKPWFAVEAKVSADRADPSLVRYRELLRIPFAYQVVLEGERDFLDDGVRVLPASRFLAALA